MARQRTGRPQEGNGQLGAEPRSEHRMALPLRFRALPKFRSKHDENEVNARGIRLSCGWEADAAEAAIARSRDSVVVPCTPAPCVANVRNNASRTLFVVILDRCSEKDVTPGRCSVRGGKRKPRSLALFFCHLFGS